MSYSNQENPTREAAYTANEKIATSNKSISHPEPTWSDNSTNEHFEDDDPEQQQRQQYHNLQTADLRKTTSNVLNRIASRVTTRSLPDPGPPPDGGLKAWTQCGMAFLVVFSTWGYVNSFGAFQTYYSSTLNQSDSDISWIGSVQVWVLFFIGAFSGRALDAGFFMPAFAIGSITQVVGIFMTSISTKYWHLLLAQGLCTGLGGGIMFCPSMALLSTYFSKNKGLAVALATTGNSTGGALYPLIVRQLLPQIGFGWTVRVLGFINLACFGVAFVFMKARLPPRKSGALIDISALKEVEYMLFVLGMCFHIASLYFTNWYIASYGRQMLGLSYQNSIILLMILNGVGVPARVLTGYVADRYFGVMNTLVPLLVFTTILAFCWLAVTDQASLYIFVCFYGIALASYQSLLPTAVGTMTKDIRKTGTRLGMVFTFLSFAALVGPPIGGALLGGDGGTYTHAQIWSGCTATIGTCLVAAARVYKYGWTVKIKC